MRTRSSSRFSSSSLSTSIHLLFTLHFSREGKHTLRMNGYLWRFNIHLIFDLFYRFVGYPGNYNTLLGIRNEDVSVYNVGKQIFYLSFHIVRLWINLLNPKCTTGSTPPLAIILCYELFTFVCATPKMPSKTNTVIHNTQLCNIFLSIMNCRKYADSGIGISY